MFKKTVMGKLFVAGLVIGGFGLLILIIGGILMATAKACTNADEECNSSRNRRRAGIGMVVMGCVLCAVGAVLLFLYSKPLLQNGNTVTAPSSLSLQQLPIKNKIDLDFATVSNEILKSHGYRFNLKKPDKTNVWDQLALDVHRSKLYDTVSGQFIETVEQFRNAFEEEYGSRKLTYGLPKEEIEEIEEITFLDAIALVSGQAAYADAFNHFNHFITELRKIDPMLSIVHNKMDTVYNKRCGDKTADIPVLCIERNISFDVVRINNNDGDKEIVAEINGTLRFKENKDATDLKDAFAETLEYKIYRPV